MTKKEKIEIILRTPAHKFTPMDLTMISYLSNKKGFTSTDHQTLDKLYKKAVS